MSFHDESYLNQVISQLRAQGIVFANGLSEIELTADLIQIVFDFAALPLDFCAS